MMSDKPMISSEESAMPNARITHMLTLLSIALLPLSASAMPQTGKEVRKISLSNPISSWEALDSQHLLLTVGAKRKYLVTLGNRCHALPFAARVGVSSSNEAVYAGFDYVTADNQRCMIKAINKVESR